MKKPVAELIVLLRVHRRHRFLPAIFEQILELAAGRKLHLVVMSDRASSAVFAELKKWEARTKDDYSILTTVMESPGPIRSHEGPRWTETIQIMYGKAVEAGYPQNAAGMLWDDDILFSDAALAALKEHLDDFQVDRVDGLWLHFVDFAAYTVDDRFPTHRATMFWRVVEGDNWSDLYTRTVIGGGTHCPALINKSARVATLPGMVLHLGYAEEDRDRTWQDVRVCGQIDGHYRQLALDPKERAVDPKNPAESAKALNALREQWQ